MFRKEKQNPEKRLNAKEKRRQQKRAQAEEQLRMEYEAAGKNWKKEKKKKEKAARKYQKSKERLARKENRQKKRRRFIHEARSVRWISGPEALKGSAAVLGVSLFGTLFVWMIDLICSSLWAVLSVWGGM